VGTGRNREDIAHCICFSISNHPPEFVLFIVTEKSERETLPFVTSKLSGLKYEKRKISDENDVQTVYTSCKQFIKEIPYKPEDIAVDYTSGTKAMSAGLLLAAIATNVDTIIYIAGKRDTEGRVSLGTESALTFKPNIIYAENLFDYAISLFNNIQFDACKETLKKARNTIYEEEFQNKLSLLDKLATIYSEWDRYNIEKAFNEINTIDKNQMQFLSKWKIKNRIEQNKEFLYKEKNDKFCIERAIDLLENASRRANMEKKYDDAVARLYRLLEYGAQIKLSKKNIYKLVDNECLVDFNALSEELKTKYEKYGERLPLVRSYELLEDLGEEIGRFFMEEFNKKESMVKKLLGLRNKSILAHGFNPVEENTYLEMENFVVNFLKEFYPEIKNIPSKIKFPVIQE
ncbi:MAG TPA: TIGR02710 family CRISPR-associated CARF protein, partial [bacterium]|nr:TIGR02710 family CRISPR-associated CARF protein [bacterium]